MSRLVIYILNLLVSGGQFSLKQQGDWSLQFAPSWPMQAALGASVWNVSLSVLALSLVVYVYRHEQISEWHRLLLIATRTITFAFLLLLLNNPTLTLTQSKVEPSVLAIMIDDSASMRVIDAGAPATSRLSAAQSLLTRANASLLSTLAARHVLKLYRFDGNAFPIASTGLNPDAADHSVNIASAVQAIRALHPAGSSTQVLQSALTIASDLQNAHVAGIVMLTDGRSTPVRDNARDIEKLNNSGMPLYPIAIGSDLQPRNIRLQSLQLNDVAFSGDVVNVKAMIEAKGYEPDHLVKVILKDQTTGTLLTGVDGKPLERTIKFTNDMPQQVEMQWQTSGHGVKNVSVEAVKQPGETDETDNVKTATVSVLEAQISVLFVDGSPRWDYRYLKNALLRDKTISLSCLLASADAEFPQEGNKPLPLTRANTAGQFPITLEQLMQYDVVLLGDVDPHFFSSTQLQLINEGVSRGQGFMMVAGPRWAPQAYRNTPIEPLLPVSIAQVEESATQSVITKGFRPIITNAGLASGMFRFFSDPQINRSFIVDHIPKLFWYCRGITAKPGVGEVLAEHPDDLAPDGHKAPMLVAGRFGGRTLFSAIDDSWRWRFFKDQHVFDSYWIQQLRYLARNKKIGQRRVTFTTDRTEYELGDQINVSLRVLDPGLARQLPAQIQGQVRDSNLILVRTEVLNRQSDDNNESYRASFPADKIGTFNIQLPPFAAGMDAIQSPFAVAVPQIELVDPRVDRIQLSKLASHTMGKSIEFSNAESELDAIPSAQKIIPLVSGKPLLNTPLTLIIFMLLITMEWLVRKACGMV